MANSHLHSAELAWIWVGRTALASAAVVGLPGVSELCTEPASFSVIGDRSMVPSMISSLLLVCSCCGASEMPDAMLELPTLGAVTLLAVDIGSDMMNRFSFSMPSLDTSGVGMRGRFLSCADVTIEPFRLAFESANPRKCL